MPKQKTMRTWRQARNIFQACENLRPAQRVKKKSGNLFVVCDFFRTFAVSEELVNF